MPFQPWSLQQLCGANDLLGLAWLNLQFNKKLVMPKPKSKSPKSNESKEIKESEGIWGIWQLTLHEAGKTLVTSISRTWLRVPQMATWHTRCCQGVPLEPLWQTVLQCPSTLLKQWSAPLKQKQNRGHKVPYLVHLNHLIAYRHFTAMCQPFSSAGKLHRFLIPDVFRPKMCRWNLWSNPNVSVRYKDAALIRP